MNALAAFIALLSAVAFAGSTSLQHHAAQGAPSTVPGAFGLIRHLLGRPTWLIGQALAIIGLVLHAAALYLGSIALVQPIVISGVVLAVPVRSALSRRWPVPRELAGVAVAALGLTVFLVASSPSGGTETPSDRPALLICGASMLIAATAILLAGRTGNPTGSAFLLGIASGVLFGVVAGLMKAVVYQGTHGGLVPLITTWTSWALGALGLVAVITNQYAYRYARLSASMPVLNVVNGLAALTFGVLAYDEILRHSAFYVAIEVAGFVTITLGLLLVARIEDRETAAGDPKQALPQRS
jgi:drug/metabolite transporter (DMT)-like permease